MVALHTSSEENLSSCETGSDAKSTSKEYQHLPKTDGLMQGVAKEPFIEHGNLKHMSPSNVEEVGSSLSQKNVVWLHPNDLEKLQSKHSQKSSAEQWPSYLSVGMMVYQLGSSKLVTEEHFGLNPIQMKAFGKNMEDAPVRFCSSNQIASSPFKKASFQVKLHKSSTEVSSSPLLLDKKILEEKLLETIRQQPLIQKQKIYIAYSKHLSLVVTLNERTFSAPLSRGQKKIPSQFYKGYVDENTDMQINVAPGVSNIQLIENVHLTNPSPVISLRLDESDEADFEEEDDDEDSFSFSEDACCGSLMFFDENPFKEVEQSPNEKYPDGMPLVLSEVEVKKKLHEKLINEELTLKKEIKLSFAGKTLIASIHDVLYREKGRDMSLKAREKDARVSLCFRTRPRNMGGIHLDQKLSEEGILITKGFLFLKEGSSCEFEVAYKFPQRNASSSPQSYIDMSEFKKAIRNLRGKESWFVKGGWTRLNLSSGTFFFRLENVSAGASQAQDCSKCFLSIGEETDLSLSVSKSNGITLVDKSQVHDLEAITIKVNCVEKRKGFPFFGGDDDSRLQVISQKNLDKVFKVFQKDKVFFGQKLVKTIEDDLKVTLRVGTMKFEDQDLKPEFSLLGRITDQTRVQFVSTDPKKVSIYTPAEEINLKDINERLKGEFGIGGLAKQFGEITRRVVLSRSPKSIFRDYGTKPPKGILLYGPPGTGKTLLARQLGKLLSCTEDRTTMLDSTEIFSKWVGESEENVRNLFKPALTEWKRYKKGEIPHAPLHLIIMDEVDSFLKGRNDGNDPHTAKATNAFLAQIDGLGEMENLLFVGISNRKDMLDPAVLRPGRLEIQLEVGMPNSAARKEIFEIHCKKFKEKKLLKEDVDFNQLVELSKDFSGADIEGVVKEACSFAQKRSEELLISGFEESDIRKDPRCLICMKDLEEAIKKKKPEEDMSYLRLYT